MKKNPLTLTVGLLLVVIFVVLLFLGQVRQSTVVVITTFGKVTRTLTNPGWYAKWPWPIQESHVFDQRIQNFEDSLDEYLTADHYNVMSMVYVGWQITDPGAFFPKFAAGSIAEAEKNMEGLVRNAKRSVIGKHPLSDFVSTNTAEMKFDLIEGEILKIVQDQVNSQNYGIAIKYLGIKKLGFPESVTATVFKQMTSEREVLSKKTDAEGEADAARIRADANSKSSEILARADSEATRIRALGQAEAASSFAVFQQSPELANFLLNLHALEASLKDRATLIFDQQSQPFNLFQNGATNRNSIPK